MKIARRFQPAWILLLATTLATPACYTLLKHPRVDMTVYEETPDRRCTSCHTEDQIFSYFHPAQHPVYPAESDWLDPPWWWANYWYFVPSGPSNAPSALRGVRPDGKDQQDPLVGGAVNPPPGPRIIGGDIRVKDPGDQDKGNKDTGEKKDSGDKKKDDRSVRPKSNKEKQDG